MSISLNNYPRVNADEEDSESEYGSATEELDELFCNNEELEQDKFVYEMEEEEEVKMVDDPSNQIDDSLEIDDGFNSMNVIKAFKRCVRSDGVTIDMRKFIDAYKELVKFFNHLGKLFTFVPADLIDKFDNLEKCMTNDGDKNNYETIQRAIDYEKEHNIYMVNHNATLSLLRLMRGLEFLRKIMENVFENQDNNKKTHELAVNAYDTTLAHRHKWAVRKLVKTGFYLLPKKSELIKIMMRGADPTNDRAANDKMYQDMLNSFDRVYLTIREIYERNDFLELVLV